MSGENDFHIEEGRLIKYTGNRERVEIPASVTAIESHAFGDCRTVRSIVIPASVESIGYYAVSDCPLLEELWVDRDNRKYFSSGNCVIDKEASAVVLGCQAGVIPDDGSVTAIAEFAFANCVALERIVIPGTVKQIRNYAFDGCYNLNSVEILNDVNPAVYWHVPLDYIGYRAFAGCDGLEAIVIPKSVGCIGDKAFFECSNLKSVTVTDSLNFIGIDAFGRCSEDLVMIAPADSYAEAYALENRIKIETI